jgi:two-component system sensor histidine kinase KdpD
VVQRALRLLACFAAVAVVTFVAYRVIPVNATTVGFVYLLLILIIASTWGFVEASISSLLATLAFNYFFFPPVGTFTIADPENWVALFSFLATSLIASRLSTKARRRTLEALERQQDLERLYTFSRAILLSGRDEPFPKQLIHKLADTFGLAAAVLYDRRTAEFYRAGPSDFEGLDDQLRDAALRGTSFSDAAANRTITAVRLGSEPIASLALQGVSMPDSVLQGVGNLVAIGLERAKAQDLAHQIEAARQSEQLRTALIDAMAHEFKTPLTLIKGATTSVLAGHEQFSASTREQLTIADEEAEHLRELLDNAIEMARLDTAHIDVHLEVSNIEGIVREVVTSMQTEIDGRPLEIVADERVPAIPLDIRLVKLALKQLLDNALKYSPPDSAVAIRIRTSDQAIFVDVTDHGAGISPQDKRQIFERFYRGSSVRNHIPGSGLGLNIAYSIMHAHHGDLTVTSQPGDTTFRMSLPVDQTGGANS